MSSVRYYDAFGTLLDDHVPRSYALYVHVADFDALRARAEAAERGVDALIGALYRLTDERTTVVTGRYAVWWRLNDDGGWVAPDGAARGGSYADFEDAVRAALRAEVAAMRGGGV